MGWLVSSVRHRDRALTLGVLGGILMSIVGLWGYIVAPLLFGDVAPVWGHEPTLLDALVRGGFDMHTRAPGYHGVVLVLPSFMMTLVGLLLIQRWQLDGWRPALKVVGGVVLVPPFVCTFTYFITAVGIGILWGLAGAMEEGILMTIWGFIGGFYVFTMGALIFGLTWLALSLPIVSVGTSLGAAGGYLLTTGYARLREPRESDG